MKTHLLALPVLLLALSAAAQAGFCESADDLLAKRYKAMKYYGSYSHAVDDMSAKVREERFEHAALEFMHALKAHLSEEESWQCSLPVTDKEGLDISAAENGKLRVFTWDKQTGGTEHRYAALAQARHNGGTVLTDLPDGWTQWTFDDHYRYLGDVYGLSVNEVYGTSDYGETLRLYQIHKQTGELVPLPIIQDRDHPKETADALTYRYNRLKTDEDLESSNRYLYDKDSQSFNYPVVGEDGRITTRRTFYRYHHHSYLDKNKRRIHVHRFRFVR